MATGPTRCLNITMLGARGVGKTTLLASIYNEFDKTVGDIGLALTPDYGTSAILQQRLAELRRQAEVFSATGGIDGTNTPMEFVFDLGMIGNSPELRLIFKDFPGGYIKDKINEVKGYIEQADVILLAIDAPAMMEEKGIWHDQINAPQMITDLIKKALQSLDQTTKTKLLIMAPVKCETYLQSKTEVKRLLDNIKEKYRPLLGFLKNDSLLGKVAVVVAPIQTLGCVRFSHIEKISLSEPRFYFRKISPEAPYQPKDVEEVLKYTLSFTIKKYLDGRGIVERFFDWLRGLSKPFREGLNKMTKSLKESEGFEIIQGGFY